VRLRESVVNVVPRGRSLRRTTVFVYEDLTFFRAVVTLCHPAAASDRPGAAGITSYEGTRRSAAATALLRVGPIVDKSPSRAIIIPVSESLAANGNESAAPIQLAQCWFPRLAISGAKI